MIEVNPWLFLYAVLWALLGQAVALYLVVRTLEHGWRTWARRRSHRKPKPPEIIRP